MVKACGHKPYLPILLIIMTLFTACAGVSPDNPPDTAGNSENTAQDRVALKLWYIWATDSESNKKPFEKALNDWNTENPGVRIVGEATENETYKTKIRTAIAVNEAPDIFYSWGAGFARPFVDAGKVLDLSDYLNDGTLARLVPGSLDNFTYNGRIYGLPIYMIAGVFYCNRELFARCGVKIPETFDELLEAVKGFKENGVIPMTVGEKDGWPGIFYQNILAIRTAGTKLCNEALNKQAPFNLPAFTESAARLKELIDAGAFDSRCMDLTRDESEADFKNGRVAMYYNGSWFAGSLDDRGCPVYGKIIVKNFPVIVNANGDPNGFLGGAIDTFMVSSGTRHREAAVTALKSISENFCRESYLSGAGLPAWRLDGDDARISPLAADISELLKRSSGLVLAWDTLLEAPEAQRHINLVADIFAGRITPEEFAVRMQKLNEPSG